MDVAREYFGYEVVLKHLLANPGVKVRRLLRMQTRQANGDE